MAFAHALRHKNPPVQQQSPLLPNTCCTGVRQNFARRSCVPIDNVAVHVDCLQPGTAPLEAPAAGRGVYITGMYLEGARWDTKSGQLEESLPGVRMRAIARLQHPHHSG